MLSTFFDWTTSRSFVNVVRNGVIGCLVAMFVVTIVLPFLAEFPGLQNAVFKLFSVGPWLIGLGLVLLIPAMIQFVIAVKNGAPIFSLSSGSRRYQPWPAHTHSVARRTAWGGLDVADDVRGRQTKPKVVSASELIVTTHWSRKIFAFCLLFVSLTLLLVYPVSHSLVYEVVPIHIAALQNTTAMIWPLLIIPGLITLIVSGWLFCTSIPIVKFDKVSDSVSKYRQRFFGLFNTISKPDAANWKMSSVAGLQLISYRAKSTRQNNRLLDQFELNLVFDDGSRQLLCKQSSHKTIRQDALQLARFLELPIWDRSGYYSPDDPALLQPVDPLIRPL